MNDLAYSREARRSRTAAMGDAADVAMAYDVYTALTEN